MLRLLSFKPLLFALACNPALAPAQQPARPLNIPAIYRNWVLNWTGMDQSLDEALREDRKDLVEALGQYLLNPGFPARLLLIHDHVVAGTQVSPLLISPDSVPALSDAASELVREIGKPAYMEVGPKQFLQWLALVSAPNQNRPRERRVTFSQLSEDAGASRDVAVSGVNMRLMKPHLETLLENIAGTPGLILLKIPVEYLFLDSVRDQGAMLFVRFLPDLLYKMNVANLRVLYTTDKATWEKVMQHPRLSREFKRLESRGRRSLMTLDTGKLVRTTDCEQILYKYN